MFFMVFSNIEDRTNAIKRLKNNEILAVFHYISLHSSPYYTDKYSGAPLPNTDKFTDCLLRLPMFYELTFEEIDTIVECIKVN
jgi:dTDP-4-amino-4,6-dideoxygalactose transaminase